MTKALRMVWQLAVAFWLCGFLLPVDPRAAESVTQYSVLKGIVVKVHDGDSLVVQAGNADVEVRLADVDAPERGQPHADQARKALTDLLQRRAVSVEVLDVDQYRRKVARVRRVDDGLDINTEVVRRGHAWVYRRYVRDQNLFAVEQNAKDHRLGLWALPEEQRVPPWRYRAIERSRLQ